MAITNAKTLGKCSPNARQPGTFEVFTNHRFWIVHLYFSFLFTFFVQSQFVTRVSRTTEDSSLGHDLLLQKSARPPSCLVIVLLHQSWRDLHKSPWTPATIHWVQQIAWSISWWLENSIRPYTRMVASATAALKLGNPKASANGLSW